MAACAVHSVVTFLYVLVSRLRNVSSKDEKALTLSTFDLVFSLLVPLNAHTVAHVCFSQALYFFPDRLACWPGPVRSHALPTTTAVPKKRTN
jgi:hypothetical protein